MKYEWSEHRTLYSTLVHTVYRKFEKCIQYSTYVCVSMRVRFLHCKFTIDAQLTLNRIVKNHRLDKVIKIFFFSHSHTPSFIHFHPPLILLSLSLCLSFPHSRLDLGYFAFHLWESGADESQMMAPCTSIFPSSSSSSNTLSPSSYPSSHLSTPSARPVSFPCLFLFVSLCFSI